MQIGGQNVSRETSERLEVFAALVAKWNPKINLVSKHSLPHLWERHISDSVQLHNLAGEGQNWVDLGSGGGFPGIVIAILADELVGGRKTTLVESDQRKCAFLRTVVRELGLDVTVLSERIETLDPLSADVISARALAELDLLLEFTERHLGPNGVALFPKGRTWQNEDSIAQARWSYHLETVKSVTDADAAILKIKDLARA